MTDHHDHGVVLVCEISEKFGHTQLVFDIKIGSRLIEKKDIRFLDESARQHRFLVLSRAEFVELIFGQIEDAHFIERLEHYPDVLSC